MNIGLLSILHTQIFDFHRGLASNYANALKNAIELHLDGTEKKQGFFFSAQRAKAGLEDKLYVGNIHRIENHLYWNDEELQDDDQIVDVVWVDGPITRDGGACSYGTKDMRDQVMYANTIPQVVGHLFYINTPGGESSARNDYEMMINDCREKGKSTVAFVDGLCASSGVNLASRCDRVIVMSPHDEFGCIGSMAAFWATPDGAIDQDGTRYVEIVGDECPAKNDWYREAAHGDYEKLQALINKSTQEFHQSVRENRPLVKDWMLTGEIFEAQDVIPALVDEIGDYNRAIECVFQLADQTLPAARFAVPDQEDKPDGEATDGNEPEEMAKLTEQQKAAISTSKGDLVMAQDGHVTKDVQGLFGPETVEVATPKNDNNMTDEEKKVAEVAEQPTTTRENEAPAQEAVEQPAQEEQETAEGQAAEDVYTIETGGSATTTAKVEMTDVTTETVNPSDEQPAEEQPSEETTEATQADIDKISETLHNAEQMIADKDKEIENLKSACEGQKNNIEQLQADVDAARKGLDEANAAIEAKDKTIDESARIIAEKQAEIDTLKKQVADLNAEVKELSEKPAPMMDADAGVPAGNGTGEAPKVKQSKFHRGMSYEEYLKAAKE